MIPTVVVLYCIALYCIVAESEPMWALFDHQLYINQSSLEY